MDRYRILIIDDDEPLANDLAILLSDRFVTEVAITTARGWEVVQERPPDLVLLDLHIEPCRFSDSSHDEGLAFLNALRPVSKVPCIMMSEHWSTELMETALRWGAIACLDKPLDVHQLELLIASTLVDTRL